MKTTRNQLLAREGFALPAAILGLVVVGALVTGGFYVAQQESRISMAGENSTLALYLAEEGINQSLANWNNNAWGNLQLWSEQGTVNGVGSGGSWVVDITRMPDNLYFLESTGTITAGGLRAGATRTIGVTSRLNTIDLNPPAALTTRGNVRLAGGAQITGADTNPPGWTGDVCPPATGDTPGVMHDGSGSVTTSGTSTITGTPADSIDNTITDETFTDFGMMGWDDLVALAKRPPGPYNGMAPSLTAGGECNTADLMNWGDPNDPDGPCGDYFPIIYIDGDATMQGNSVGQGILLVDGNLDLRGNFIFNGIILVQGAFDTQGAGHRIMGGVMASNANIDQADLVGASVVQNSRCAVTRAVTSNSSLTRVRPLASRSWVDLTSVMF
ncbi:MAG: hypothetical protein WEA09_15270 [Gemmatimonadota bacterium]